MRIPLAVASLVLLAGCSGVSMSDFPDRDYIRVSQREAVGGWDVLVTNVDVSVSPHTDCFTGCAPYYDAQYTVHVEVVRTAETPQLRLRAALGETGIRGGGSTTYDGRSDMPVVPFDLPMGELWKGTACVGTPELDVRKTHKEIPLEGLYLESGGARKSIRLVEENGSQPSPPRNTTGATQVRFGEPFDLDGLRYVVEPADADGAYVLRITVQNPGTSARTTPLPQLRANDRLGNWTVIPAEPYWSTRCGWTPEESPLTIPASSNVTLDRPVPLEIGKASFQPPTNPPPTYLELGPERRLLRVDFARA